MYSFSDQPPITPQLLLIVCTPVSTHILPPSPLNWRKKPSGWLCVVGIHGCTLDARRSEWCATLRVNHCIFNPCPPSVRALFLHNRTANDPGAFKNPHVSPSGNGLAPTWSGCCSPRLGHTLRRGFWEECYPNLMRLLPPLPAQPTSRCQFVSPLICCVEPSARRVRIGSALSVWCFSII